jgi:hypothetical protein
MKFLIALSLIFCGYARAAQAAPAPFDLSGPTLEVKVTRGLVTLPIAEVPNLAPGDRLWIKADLPPNQSAHYLLIAAFLNGATNPPPPSAFYRCATWNDRCARDGLSVTVPDDAQQVLVFLAPETGGDFRTLVGTVRGRPGVFVRTSQDLNQAALDRTRLEAYLRTIRSYDETDPEKLKEVAPLLARTLAIHVDDKCLEKLPSLQAPCLMQGQETLILNDGHSTSIVEALTSGPAADLAMEASYTPQLNYGYYSPYVASVLDIARLLDLFHTAQYQYIPALPTAKGDRLTLTLNAAPSFNNPKSVLVTALPAVEKPQLPPLHALDPKQIYCARKATLVLPVEGAPLVFSTAYAHDMTLRLTGSDGKTIDLPVQKDPGRGGLVVDTTGIGASSLGDTVEGELRGLWGFDTYDGPTFSLVNAHVQPWQMVAGNQSPLIVGRDETVHLQANNVSCIDTIMLKDPAGKDLKVDWKSVKPNEVELKLPLTGAQPGDVTLLVQQFGTSEPQPVQLRAFSEASHLEGFEIHAGDSEGTLRGSRLDEVASLSMNGLTFLPDKLSDRNGQDELTMSLANPTEGAALKPETTLTARVLLKDGRPYPLTANIDAPRPSVRLISKSVQPSVSSSDSNILLTNQNEVPQDAKLIFSLRSQSPARFVRDETVEVATDDESYATTLSVANGGLTLEDAHVAVATLNPAKAFGSSAFGPLQFRVTANGVNGEWQPLATLVRLPVLKDLQCPATPELACKLTGSNLFLVDSLSEDPHFTHPVHVPDGFPGATLPVPHLTDGQLYVRLRDDPAVISAARLTAQQLPPSPEELARADARREAVPVTDAPAAPPANSATGPASITQPMPASPAATAPPAATTPGTSSHPAMPTSGAVAQPALTAPASVTPLAASSTASGTN